MNARLTPLRDLLTQADQQLTDQHPHKAALRLYALAEEAEAIARQILPQREPIVGNPIINTEACS